MKIVDDDGKPFSVSSTGAATQVAAISFVGEDSDAVVALVGDRQESVPDAPTTEREAELPAAGGEPLAVWHIPYPPGVPLDGAIVPSATRIEEAASSIDMPLGAGSLYEIRDLDWTGWGGATPEATGRARYCSDSCTDWAIVQIQLDGRVALSCDADEPSVFNYTRYQLTGFHLLEANEYEATAIC